MSRLSPMFLLWLLLLLAAAPASAVLDVQPRNHAWEPPASSYDLAPDVRDGPNLYAYVKQNPWTMWDPEGLCGWADPGGNFFKHQMRMQQDSNYAAQVGQANQQALAAGGRAAAYGAASLADGVVNSFVAIFGGPGKGSFNPSPIRRSWGMSPGLTVDRETYRTMQDATEAAVFALSGASKNVPPRVSSEPPVATGKATLNKSQALINRETGDAWENKIFDARQSMNGNAVRQFTIKGNESGKKTKIDVASRDPQTGAPVLDEGKASATAPLTKNQTQVFPELERSGGVVVGKGKPGFEGGTVIPPTKVNIIRPPQEEKK